MPDVNVLVAAHRTDAPHHLELKDWLEAAVGGAETLGLSDSVLTGFVRIVTHPRVFAQPTPGALALQQAAALRAAPGCSHIVPGSRFWGTFHELCLSADARGNLVADAAHAALAMEAGAVWVTLDRDFARFDGLSWRSPL